MPTTRRFWLTLVPALVLWGTSAAAADIRQFVLDTEHVHAGFRVQYLGYSNVFGRFNRIQGELLLDEQRVENSRLKVVIEAASIDTNHPVRDEYLRSPDFFNVHEFSTLSFVSTQIRSVGENAAKVAGELTILGITRPVILDVVLNRIGPHPFDAKKPPAHQRYVAGFSARGSVRRSDYGMRFALSAISDEVELTLESQWVRR